MRNILLEVQNNFGYKTTLNAPEDVLLQQIADLAADSLGMAFQTPSGTPIEYALFHNQRGRFLNLELSLHGHNIDNGDQLRVLPRSRTNLFELELQSKPNPGMLFPLPLRETRVGRDFSNNVVIRHRSISRQHGVFEWKDGFHIYMDLGSANGSWINNQPVKQPIPIASGDVISLSQSVQLSYRERQQPYDTAQQGAEDVGEVTDYEDTNTRLMDLGGATIYIAFSPSQAYSARAIAERLEQATARAIMYKAGDRYEPLQAAAMVIILSRESVAIPEQQSVWSDFYRSGKPIVPVLYEPSQVPPYLSYTNSLVEYRNNDTRLASDVLDMLYMLLFPK